MDIVRTAYLICVVYLLCLYIGQQLRPGNAPDAEVHGLAPEVIAVFRGAGQLIIVGLTPYPAGNICRCSKMLPHPVCQPDKRFIRFHRKSTAPSAWAPKLLPLKIPDFVPECPGGFLRCPGGLFPEPTLCHRFQQGRLGQRAGAAVLLQSLRRLERQHRPAGISPGYTVHFPRVIAQVYKQRLDLPGIHGLLLQHGGKLLVFRLGQLVRGKENIQLFRHPIGVSPLDHSFQSSVQHNLSSFFRFQAPASSAAARGLQALRPYRPGDWGRSSLPVLRPCTGYTAELYHTRPRHPLLPHREYQ